MVQSFNPKWHDAPGCAREFMCAGPVLEVVCKTHMVAADSAATWSGDTSLGEDGKEAKAKFHVTAKQVFLLGKG